MKFDKILSYTIKAFEREVVLDKVALAESCRAVQGNKCVFGEFIP